MEMRIKAEELFKYPVCNRSTDILICNEAKVAWNNERVHWFLSVIYNILEMLPWKSAIKLSWIIFVLSAVSYFEQPE